jgi:hypothetical protein
MTLNDRTVIMTQIKAISAIFPAGIREIMNTFSSYNRQFVIYSLVN